jgi:hypothetical protein
MILVSMATLQVFKFPPIALVPDPKCNPKSFDIIAVD